MKITGRLVVPLMESWPFKLMSTLEFNRTTEPSPMLRLEPAGMVRLLVTAMRELGSHTVLPLRVPDTDVQLTLLSRLMVLLAANCRT